MQNLPLGPFMSMRYIVTYCKTVINVDIVLIKSVLKPSCLSGFLQIRWNSGCCSVSPKTIICCDGSVGPLSFLVVYFANFCCSRGVYLLLCIIRNWRPTRYNFLVYLFVSNQLYMFRAMFSPITRTLDCIYSFWYSPPMLLPAGFTDEVPPRPWHRPAAT